jgi:lysylphosphatidylglycerol synthetase-like protein (DUF2156 family)
VLLFSSRAFSVKITVTVAETVTVAIEMVPVIFYSFMVVVMIANDNIVCYTYCLLEKPTWNPNPPKA